MRVHVCARERVRVRVRGKVCARAGAAACAGVGSFGRECLRWFQSAGWLCQGGDGKINGTI